MNERRHFGITLLTATILLFTAGYFAQCASAVRHTAPRAAATVPPAAGIEDREAEHREQSVREMAHEEEKEEGAKVQGIAHALQTIAANPELRRTYGLKK